jgi:hypothetical protein
MDETCSSQQDLTEIAGGESTTRTVLPHTHLQLPIEGTLSYVRLSETAWCHLQRLREPTVVLMRDTANERK